MISPTLCTFAPPGEYIKDHTLFFRDGYWHLLSISGVQGYSHLHTGNEESFSWSVSRDLVHWEFRGHVLYASLREGEFDRHEVWAPFCIRANEQFHLFYTGIVHPHRPLCYEREGILNPCPNWEGHRETIGLAVSDDLCAWTKVSDRVKGLSVPGRDPHVVYDEEGARWLLYSTGGIQGDKYKVYVSQSKDLLNWEFLGVCALIPNYDDMVFNPNESITVLKHPLNDRWILLANWQYTISDNPLDFTHSEVHEYFDNQPDHRTLIRKLGFASETIEWDGKWYRSAVMGVTNHWVLGFHEIEWELDGAFKVVRDSVVKWIF